MHVDIKSKGAMNLRSREQFFFGRLLIEHVSIVIAAERQTHKFHIVVDS